MSTKPVLEVSRLTVEIDRQNATPVTALDGISFQAHAGRTLCLVGESGCGKSLTGLALMGLLPKVARVRSGEMRLGSQQLENLTSHEWQKVRGSKMAMIFQDPMTSLNPAYPIGFQIAEMVNAHEEISSVQLKSRVIELLKQVGIPDPERRLLAYPHQCSGGMNQRVMIAMAIAARPEVLIADEPTTALDVTVQAQILSLLTHLQKETGMTLILITHDLRVVSEMAHDIAVLYAGQVVESGKVREILKSPKHPYTKALLLSLPDASSGYEGHGVRARLPSIPGLVPSLADRPKGCQFNPRCFSVKPPCRESVPDMTSDVNRGVRCHYPLV